jgi:uncharacterized membrane protein
MAAGGKEQEHVSDAARMIHELRAQRRKDLPPLKRLVERAVGRFATPWAILAAVLFIAIWVGLQFALTAHGKPFDSNTFGLLGVIAQLCSLILVIGILVADGAQAEIDQERSRLILELLIIQDRKISEGFNLRNVEQPTDVHEAARALHEAEQQEQGRPS